MPKKTPEELIEAIYAYIQQNPKHVMSIQDIYALYDIATRQLGRYTDNT